MKNKSTSSTNLDTQSNMEKLKSPFEAARIFVNSFVKISASLLSLTAVLYVIGWFGINSFYEHIGASWILHDVNATSIIGHSLLPITSVLFMIYFGMNMISDNRKKFISIIRYIFKSVLLLVAVLVILSSMLERYNMELTLIIRSITLIIYLIFSSAGILAFILDLQESTFKWKSVTNAITYSILIFGFYLAPAEYGDLKAKIALRSNFDSFPNVILNEKSNDKIKLIYNIEDRFYVAILDSNNKYPSYKLISPKEIARIIQKK